MTTAVSVHRCLAGRGCRRADVVDSDRHGALTDQPNTLCDVCRKHIESAVRQLPRDWADLRATLGERAANTGQRIRSTPTPAILISTRKEALMAAIVDMADRAAAVVSDALNTGQPATYHGRGYPPHAQHTLRASISITEPHIDLLAIAPAEPAIVWKKPKRCDTHAHLIGSAESMLAAAKPRQIRQAHDCVRRAYAAAGACEDCNGWGDWGQERELIEISGLQIALELVELHNQARAELGVTRLRHRFPMPCPRCGGRVGRDDGETIITCDDRDTCKSTWTEREYKFLAGLITQERLDMEILKWLLAESYSRLDDAQRRITLITDSDANALTLPGAGAIVVEAIRQALDGHPTPEQRVITTERTATEERQTEEDNWAWTNQTPYRPPKPKPRKATKPVANPIHPASLTMLIDTDPIASLNGRMKCSDCNMIHAGDCP
jgi:hypothetical protein